MKWCFGQLYYGPLSFWVTPTNTQVVCRTLTPVHCAPPSLPSHLTHPLFPWFLLFSLFCLSTSQQANMPFVKNASGKWITADEVPSGSVVRAPMLPPLSRTLFGLWGALVCDTMLFMSCAWTSVPTRPAALYYRNIDSVSSLRVSD